MSRSHMKTSSSLSSLFHLPPSSSTTSLASNENDNFSWEGDVSHGTIYSISSSPQRRPGRPTRGFQDIADDLPASRSLQSTTSQSNNHGHTRRMSTSSTSSSMTIRPLNATPGCRRPRRTHRPSISVSSSTTHTSGYVSRGPRHSLASGSGCSTSGRTHGQPYQYLSSHSHASIKTRSTHVSSYRSSASTSRRRKKAPSLDMINRSYTVFRKRFFRLKRQERVLLLDKQWVHLLPSSTKKLNHVFDTRKSVSYHIRLLASARVKPRCSTIIVEFKRGSRGRLKKYNLKVKNQATASDIVQALWQSKTQFSEP